MSGRLAWGLAIALLALGLLGALVYPSPVWAPADDAELAAAGGNDAEMYREVADRFANGEPYYPTLGAALRDGGFPRRPVFNWRTPLHLPALGLLRAWGLTHVAFGLLVIPAFLALLHAWRDVRPLRIAGAVSLGGLIAAPLFHSTLYLFAEVWCGAALFLGFALRGSPLRSVRLLGAASIVLALFLRELALPWLLVAAVVDVSERRWLSGGTLLIGLGAWAAWFAVHVSQVNAHLIPGLDDHVRSWVAFGGLPFLLDSLRYFPLVTLVPRLAPLIVAVGLIAAAACWRSPHRALALALVGWWFSLLIFGRDVNHYWGAVAALPLALLFMAAIVGGGQGRRAAEGAGGRDGG